jgi:hypothetical protein
MGLDWKKIREEYQTKASPEELEGPFDEAGNLKGKVQEKVNKENAAKNRVSRAKPNAMSRAEAGKMARRPHKKSPEVRAEMVRLYREGMNMNEIGRRTGSAAASVRSILIQEGVHAPKARPGTPGTDR